MFPVKLHLGCGNRNFGDDWISIDKGDFPHVKSHDIVNLPVRNGSADVIYASHVLEYFDREQARFVLGKWHEALKPEGLLRLAVPDFEAMAKLYVEGKFPLESFLGPLYGKMNVDKETIYHRTVYDFEDLANMLHSVGFNAVRRYDWLETEHASIDDCSQAYLPKMDKVNGYLISLNIEATE